MTGFFSICYTKNYDATLKALYTLLKNIDSSREGALIKKRYIGNYRS